METTLLGERALAKRMLAVFVALLMAVAMVACGGDDEDGTEEPAAQGSETPTREEGESSPEEEGDDETVEEAADELIVTATEYQFDFPATLPAGQTTITLKNEGEQPHHLIMAKLTDNAPPIEELIKMKNPNKFLAEDITGNKPPMAAPGQTADSLDVELTPGTYGYVCFIPDKEKKKPHAFLGMNGTFTVE